MYDINNTSLQHHFIVSLITIATITLKIYYKFSVISENKNYSNTFLNLYIYTIMIQISALGAY